MNNERIEYREYNKYWCPACVHCQTVINPKKKTESYFCRRYPPHLIITAEGLKSAYPKVKKTDCCGEIVLIQANSMLYIRSEKTDI